jgi:hypothetical protein
VAEAETSGPGKPRRQSPTSKKTTTTETTTTGATSDSEGSAADTPSSSATTSDNPLGLEEDRWSQPDRELPADTGDDLDYVAPPPQILEWTPERAGAIVRAGGFLLHTADPIARDEVAKELEVDLWRATEDDVSAIAPPLARILNRYEPARRLAGVSDEMELAFGMIGYLRENMADRGRIVTAKRRREAEQTGEDGTILGGETFGAS